MLSMDSSTSDPKKSLSVSSKPPQKRIYLQPGILESKKDVAERMLRRMVEEGMLPLRKNRE